MLEFSELTEIKRVMNFFNSDFSLFVDSFLHSIFASVLLTDGRPKHSATSAEITPLLNMVNRSKTFCSTHSLPFSTF
jgi:hypothetical protein